MKRTLPAWTVGLALAIAPMAAASAETAAPPAMRVSGPAEIGTPATAVPIADPGPAPAPPAVTPGGEPAPAVAAARLRAYAGLSDKDAVTRSLIDGDIDHAIALVRRNSPLEGWVWSGYAAFAAGDHIESLRIAETAGLLSLGGAPGLVVHATLLNVWSLAALGRTRSALELLSETGDQPMLEVTRGLLLDHAGDREGSAAVFEGLRAIRTLQAFRYASLRHAARLAEAGKRAEALRVLDEVVGPDRTPPDDVANLRAQLTRGETPAVPPVVPAHALADQLADIAVFTLYMPFGSDMQPDEDQPVLTIGRPGASPAAPAQFDFRLPSPDGEEEDASPDAQAYSFGEMTRAFYDSKFVYAGLAGRMAVALNPDHEMGRLVLATLLDTYEATEAAEAVLTTPGRATGEIIAARARLLSSTYRTREALAALDTVPEPQRGIQWHIDRAWMLVNAGDIAGADAVIGSARRLARPGDSDPMSSLALAEAYAMIMSGRRAEGAAAAARAAEQLEPDSLLRLQAARLIAQDPAQRGRAIELARQSLAGPFSDIWQRIAVGAFLVDFKESRTEGLALLRAGIEALPRSAYTLNALGYALVEVTGAPAEGYVLIRRALSLLPNDPGIKDSLGRALYRLGHPEDALPYAEAAVAGSGAYPNGEVLANLGDVLWTLGRHDAARARWREAQSARGLWSGREDLAARIRDGLRGPPPVAQPVPRVVDADSI